MQSEHANRPEDRGQNGDPGDTEQPRFVQFLFFKVDPAWRRLAEEERTRGKREFARLVEQITQSLPSLKGALPRWGALPSGGPYPGVPAVRTFAYSTLGLKVDADLMLWRTADSLDTLQETLAGLLKSEIGAYLSIANSLFGMTRPSQYTKRRTTQEQAIDEQERLRYLTVYPFSKTTEWYLMSREARQGMMNEHMRVGHEHSNVRQVLLYTTGLDDQEFVVAYETDDLYEYQGLLIALRSTEARRYTLKDQPIFTCIHRPLSETLDLLG